MKGRLLGWARAILLALGVGHAVVSGRRVEVRS